MCLGVWLNATATMTTRHAPAAPTYRNPPIDVLIMYYVFIYSASQLQECQ